MTILPRPHSFLPTALLLLTGCESAPTQPPPFVPPAVQGIRIAASGDVIYAVETPLGFYWAESAGPRTIHRWTPDGGERLLGSADVIEQLSVRGERAAWVEDARRVQLAEPLRTLWEDPEARLRDVVLDETGGVVLVRSTLAGGYALIHLSEAGERTVVASSAVDLDLAWADGACVWATERGNQGELVRLDRATGSWRRYGMVSRSAAWVRDGQIYSWSWRDKEWLRAVALDGTGSHAVGALRDPDPDGDGIIETSDPATHRVTWAERDGRPLASFVVPDQAVPFRATRSTDHVFWWTRDAVGIEPLQPPSKD